MGLEIWSDHNLKFYQMKQEFFMLRCTTKESQCLLLNVALSVTICHSVKATLCPETFNIIIDVSLSVHFDRTGHQCWLYRTWHQRWDLSSGGLLHPSTTRAWWPVNQDYSKLLISFLKLLKHFLLHRETTALPVCAERRACDLRWKSWAAILHLVAERTTCLDPLCQHEVWN